MPPEELDKILKSHHLWLSSDGKEGERANLEGAELGWEDLRNASLDRAEFKNADLTEANLQRAELRRASFDGAILRRTSLREADLQNANLENASSLLTSQLAGADVAGAKLPSAIAEFKGLETIAEATSNAQKLFVAMLGGCLYSWLTIGTTKDVALLTNSASSPLPIIGTALPIVGFYMVAPVVLLAIYFYFHLNMQRLWEALADLPAVFPDGRSLDKRADPWLLNGLVSAHFVRLRRERPPLSRVQEWLSILLAWWAVPLTLFVFWGRFLPRHDWFGTSLHIGLLAVAIGFGWMSYRLACRTLRGARRTPFRWTQAWKHGRTLMRIAGILGTCGVGVGFYFVSLIAIEDIPPDRKRFVIDRLVPETYSSTNLVPRILRTVGFRTYLYLVEEDLSIKPANWTGSEEQYRMVKGANLDGANMQYANAASSFLANATLRTTNLREADLSFANLTNANLGSVNLYGASLWMADLSGAFLHEKSNFDLFNGREANFNRALFEHANLTGADFSGADLRGVASVRGVLLRRANLNNANLREVDLSQADLTAANFKGANLSKANLFQAKLDSVNLLGADLSNVDLSEVRSLSSANLEGATLDGTNLKGLDLRQVKGLTRSQIQTAITDDKTLLPVDLPP
jgi:uncharacterized protein YjbI with pentapeptide repeats